MAEPGVSSTIVKKEDKLVPELLIAQRNELQNSISQINVHLEQAAQTLSAEQAENIEHLRETRDNLEIQKDKVEALLAKANPDVLTEQATGLPTERVAEDNAIFGGTLPAVPADEPLDPDSPLAKIDPSVIDGTKAPETLKVSETEGDPTAKLDEKLRSLYEQKSEVLDQYESEMLAATKKRDEGLAPINVGIEESLKKKLAYVKAMRHLEEVKKEL